MCCGHIVPRPNVALFNTVAFIIMNVQKIDLSDCDAFNAHTVHSQKVKGFFFPLLHVKQHHSVHNKCFPLNN